MTGSRHSRPATTVPADQPDPGWITAEVQALLAAAGLDASAAGHDPDLAMAVRLATTLGQRLELDPWATAALLQYLRRIHVLEAQVRALQPAHHRGGGAEHEGPAPWHEPHD